MLNPNRYQPDEPTNGDIAVQMWAEACGEEELERIAKFLGRQVTQEPSDTKGDV